MCDRLQPVALSTRVLVLQHPQEIDVDLGTVGLLTQSSPTVMVRPGLSWASLAHATSDPDARSADWAVLWGASLPRPLTEEEASREVVVLPPKGRPLREAPFVGLVALDGTWSQAKALWWRNAWLLKLHRVVLHPSQPGIYGRLRREPRRGAVSTLEALALALAANSEDPAASELLRRLMRTMCQRARDVVHK